MTYDDLMDHETYLGLDGSVRHNVEDCWCSPDGGERPGFFFEAVRLVVLVTISSVWAGITSPFREIWRA